jgi:hypothetical protein
MFTKPLTGSHLPEKNPFTRPISYQHWWRAFKIQRGFISFFSSVFADFLLAFIFFILLSPSFLLCYDIKAQFETYSCNLCNCKDHTFTWKRVRRSVINLVEVEVNLRPTVSRSVYLGVRRSSGTRDQFFFLFEISFRQLRGFVIL